jgi:hypothetical protein
MEGLQGAIWALEIKIWCRCLKYMGSTGRGRKSKDVVIEDCGVCGG